MSNFIDFNACPGYIVIEPLDTQAKTSSPFVISDTADKFETARMGTVVSVGARIKGELLINTNGLYVDAFPCKVGDVIVHKQWHSENFEYNGKHYQFVKFEDIAAVRNDVK